MKEPTDKEINNVIDLVFAVPEDFEGQVNHAELSTVGMWDGHTLESIRSFKARNGELGPVWREILDSIKHA